MFFQYVFGFLIKINFNVLLIKTRTSKKTFISITASYKSSLTRALSYTKNGQRVMQFPVSSKSLYFILKLNSSLYPLEQSVQVTNLNTNVWLGGQNGVEVLVLGFDTR